MYYIELRDIGRSVMCSLCDHIYLGNIDTLTFRVSVLTLTLALKSDKNEDLSATLNATING